MNFLKKVNIGEPVIRIKRLQAVLGSATFVMSSFAAFKLGMPIIIIPIGVLGGLLYLYIDDKKIIGEEQEYMAMKNPVIRRILKNQKTIMKALNLTTTSTHDYTENCLCQRCVHIRSMPKN